MDIDRNAPVIARAEQHIAAPVETVWQVLTNVQNWTNWHSGIVEASVKGPVETGTRFMWRSGGFRVRSTFEVVQARERLVWSGKTTGTIVMHSWSFQNNAEGTWLVTEESLNGWVPKLFQNRMQGSLQSALETWVRVLRLKTEGMQIKVALP